MEINQRERERERGIIPAAANILTRTPPPKPSFSRQVFAPPGGTRGWPGSNGYSSLLLYLPHHACTRAPTLADTWAALTRATAPAASSAGGPAREAKKEKWAGLVVSGHGCRSLLLLPEAESIRGTGDTAQRISHVHCTVLLRRKIRTCAPIHGGRWYCYDRARQWRYTVRAGLAGVDVTAVAFFFPSFHGPGATDPWTTEG
jgi:hypothetical protein